MLWSANDGSGEVATSITLLEVEERVLEIERGACGGCGRETAKISGVDPRVVCTEGCL